MTAATYPAPLTRSGLLIVDRIEVRDGKAHPFVRQHTGGWARLPILNLPQLDDRPRDACGRRRSKATMPGFRKGQKPGNHGKKYAAQPLTNAEALAIADGFGKHPAGVRDRALWILIWRSGLRIECEALRLMAHDLNPLEGTVHVACGKGGKARTVPMDPLAWEQIAPWLALRAKYPDGPIFCVVEGRTKGVRAIGSSQFRAKLHETAAAVGVTKRVHPHGARHSLACDLVLEHVQVPLIQRQLGHSSPGTTGIYLAGLPVGELFERVAQRPAPVAGPRQSFADLAALAAPKPREDASAYEVTVLAAALAKALGRDESEIGSIIESARAAA